MKSMVLGALGTTLLLTGVAANAADAEALAKASGCLACHTTDKKLVGPAYREIAAKYRGDQRAAEGLAKKIKEGGKGVWGEVPMPPNAHVKDPDIKAIVAWVLSLK